MALTSSAAIASKAIFDEINSSFQTKNVRFSSKADVYPICKKKQTKGGIAEEVTIVES